MSEKPNNAEGFSSPDCYAAYVKGLERGAQIVRYYLRHQNLGINLGKYETGVEVTCDNLNEIISEEAKLPESESRFRRDG